MEWCDKHINSKQSASCVEDIISLMESYDKHCDYLFKHSIIQYSSFVNNTMLPYIEGVISMLQHDELESQVGNISEKDCEDLMFWLCKSYYRSVHADMVRDADDHNAKRYALLVKKHLVRINNSNKLELLKDCLTYMESATTFWEEFVAASQESKQKTTKELLNPTE